MKIPVSRYLKTINTTNSHYVHIIYFIQIMLQCVHLEGTETSVTSRASATDVCNAGNQMVAARLIVNKVWRDRSATKSQVSLVNQ